MNELYDELIKAAQLLRTVKVDGDGWLNMIAVYGSILKVATALKGEELTEPGEVAE